MSPRLRLSERGMTTIEDVIVLSPLAIVLLGLTGLHTLAISTGTAAETSSVATNLARAASAFYTIDGTLRSVPQP